MPKRWKCQNQTMNAARQTDDVQAALAAWEAGGDWLELPAPGRVFYRTAGAAEAAPARTLLLLHGYPESSFSWHKVADGLAGHCDRVVMLDMPGYGLSDKRTDTYTFSLFEQADTVLQVWRALGVRGGHLLAHDMGDSVATELVTRHVGGLLPAWFDGGLQSLTLTNGSVVLGLAKLRLMQRLLLTGLGPFLSQLATRHVFAQQARSAHGPATLSDADIDGMWINMCKQDGRRKNHILLRYLNDRRRFETTRWLPGLARANGKLPLHLCWGQADAVARVAMAHHLKQHVCPDATVTLMPGVGHFCQLSDPEPWLDAVLTYYRSAGQP